MRQADELANVIRLTIADVVEASEVLADAFADYPVMRYVIGEADESYASRLSQLTRFFVLARFLGGGVVLGVRKPNEGLVAVATILKPGRTSAPVELIEQRQSLWRQLGADARARYERYGAVTGTHVVNAPHYHLAMVGVRRSHTGRGLARHLLDAVHNQSREDPGSCGVTLNTEDPRNVRLYEHFGYQLIGHDSVPSAFDVWSFFRADD